MPRGVGNAYQTLEADTSYTYLVNDHYTPHAEYTSINLRDESVAIDWPILLVRAAVLAKDGAHPRLAEVTAVAPRRTLVLGAGGHWAGPSARCTPIRVTWTSPIALTLTSSPTSSILLDIGRSTRQSAAAYTAVDAAETPDGRAEAWAGNVIAVTRLARIASAHQITLVHISSDYVFDGAISRPFRKRTH